MQTDIDPNKSLKFVNGHENAHVQAEQTLQQANSGREAINSECRGHGRVSKGGTRGFGPGRGSRSRGSGHGRPSGIRGKGTSARGRTRRIFFTMTHLMGGHFKIHQKRTATRETFHRFDCP